MAWVKLDDQFTEHPKLERAGPLAGWLHVCALCYCARQLTDGRIPKTKALRLADVPKSAQLAAKLVAVGLWEDDGDDYVIHDYSDYNPTREEVGRGKGDLSRKRSDAGRRGALARWAKEEPSVAGQTAGMANGMANGMASATDGAMANSVASAIPPDGKDMAPSPSPLLVIPSQSVTSTDSGKSDDDDRDPSIDALAAVAEIVGTQDHRRAVADGVPVPFPDAHRRACIRKKREDDPELAEFVRRRPGLEPAAIAAEFRPALAPVIPPAVVPQQPPADDCERCGGAGIHPDPDDPNTSVRCDHEPRRQMYAIDGGAA